MKETARVMFAVLGAVLLSLPAFAGPVTIFSQPSDGVYTASTTNYGGGDRSGSAISSLGVFNFSSPLLQNSVPDSWSTWNCPPATESCSPGVLWSNGATSLILTLTGHGNTAGFELEPDMFQGDSVTADFYNQSSSLIATIALTPNGSAGALLFALQDGTPGDWISQIVITDVSNDDFAIAQLRSNGVSGVPEPATLGLGLSALLLIGLWRRKR